VSINEIEDVQLQ